jgi:hypothetical protein
VRRGGSTPRGPPRLGRGQYEHFFTAADHDVVGGAWVSTRTFVRVPVQCSHGRRWSRRRSGAGRRRSSGPPTCGVAAALPFRGREGHRVRRSTGCVARRDTAILTDNGSDDRKISVYIPKEWQPMAANDSVEWRCRPGPGRPRGLPQPVRHRLQDPRVRPAQLLGGAPCRHPSAPAHALRITEYGWQPLPRAGDKSALAATLQHYGDAHPKPSPPPPVAPAPGGSGRSRRS